MTNRELSALLIRAAEYVEGEAELLKNSHTIGGVWDSVDQVDKEAEQIYGRDMLFAAELRDAARLL